MLQHWSLVIGLVPVLLIISATTYHLIEKPCMNSVKPLNAWLKRTRTPSISRTDPN